MSRPLRIELEDGLYHVTARGDRQEPIFKDNEDRERVLEVLAQGLGRFDAVVHAYCLMGNHYHFVLQTRQANLSRMMRHVNGVYSQAFNRRHGLVGHLFQGRFKAIHVDQEAYFMEVCRYVELNPVRAGIVDEPAAWNWSSYRAHMGIDPAPAWLESKLLLSQMLGRDLLGAQDVGVARSLYVQFVESGRGEPLWAHALKQEIYLGGEAFIKRLQQRMRVGQSSIAEIPRMQRSRPEDADPAPGHSDAREHVMLRSYRDEGRTLSAIAKEWNLSVSRVSRLIKRAERATGV